MKQKSNVYVDIDETICDYEYGEDKFNYNLARPIQMNIDKINRLYIQGHLITYWTARGSRTGEDWRSRFYQYWFGMGEKFGR